MSYIGTLSNPGIKSNHEKLGVDPAPPPLYDFYLPISEDAAVAKDKKLDLKSVRQAINKIDKRIVENLSERFHLVEEVFSQKEKAQISLRDKARETQLLGDLVKLGRKQGLDAYFVTRIFQEIIDYSLKVQRSSLIDRARGGKKPDIIRAAFQGIENAYSHLVGQKYFSRCLDVMDFRPCPTFSDVIEAVEGGEADYGILPVENTTAGSINEVYDLLLKTRLSIVGEEIYAVNHCLSAVADIPLANIRRVFSHPQALAQCSNFLATLQNCHVESFTDTAESVKKVKDDQDLSEAAIASEQAALFHGLVILKRGIANQKDNFTRFFILAKEPIALDDRIKTKTSLVLSTAHKEGALARCMNKLAEHHLSMTKLESRPRPGNPWEYLFYVDFLGNINDPGAADALEALKRESIFLKVLGSYPALDREKSTPSVVDLLAADGDETGTAEDATQAPKPKPVTEIRASNRLVSRECKPENTVLNLKGVMIGTGRLTVIAGPGIIESEDHIRTCARRLKESGGHILYGGCFKSRQGRNDYSGLGFEGLNYLAKAGHDFGLPVVTEVTNPADVHQVIQQADLIQVSGRNMQNFGLLAEVGGIDRPVILKRAPMSSIEELLAAAEYILSEGNQQVILCEHGIRTLETAIRNTLDLSAIPSLKSATHLPIAVDPTHTAAGREFIGPLSQAAKCAGADVIMLQVHPDPDGAPGEGPRTLSFQGFKKLMGGLLR